MDLRGEIGEPWSWTIRCNYLKVLVGVRRFELPAPASRMQLGVYKLLLLIGMLEMPVHVCAYQVITGPD